jgi:hypothetical protein
MLEYVTSVAQVTFKEDGHALQDQDMGVSGDEDEPPLQEVDLGVKKDVTMDNLDALQNACILL